MTLLLLALLLTPLPALAYLDPTAGGALWMMLAPILAMILSAWLFVKDRIKTAMAFLKRIVRRRPLSSAAPADKRD